jgi:hypothetical protein
VFDCGSQFGGISVTDECPLSCDNCPGVCDDGICDWDESYGACADGSPTTDCGECGDGICDWSGSCSLGDDCGDAPTSNPLTETFCTNLADCFTNGGVWNANETSVSCPEDCSTCDNDPVCLDILNVNADNAGTGTLDVYMNNQPGCTYFEGTISTFSNDKDSTECATIGGIWFNGSVAAFQLLIANDNWTTTDSSVIGGIAVDLGFTINLAPDWERDVDGDGTADISGTMIIGFSLDGTAIPPGEGAFLTFAFTDYADDAICFGEQDCSTGGCVNVLSNTIGNAIDPNWGDCNCSGNVPTDNPWCSEMTAGGLFKTLAWENLDQCLCGEVCEDDSEGNQICSDGLWDDATNTCTSGVNSGNTWHTETDCEYVCGGTTAVQVLVASSHKPSEHIWFPSLSSSHTSPQRH